MIAAEIHFLISYVGLLSRVVFLCLVDIVILHRSKFGLESRIVRQEQSSLRAVHVRQWLQHVPS